MTALWGMGVGAKAACWAVFIGFAASSISLPAASAERKSTPSAAAKAVKPTGKPTAKSENGTSRGPSSVYTSMGADAPGVTSSIDGRNKGPACERNRKRLWVEGEGWVVRRVTTCY